jgi:hypothetical protein
MRVAKAIDFEEGFYGRWLEAGWSIPIDKKRKAGLPVEVLRYEIKFEGGLGAEVSRHGDEWQFEVRSGYPVGGFLSSEEAMEACSKRLRELAKLAMSLLR